METIIIPHHGRRVDGVLYRPEGGGKHPMVIVSHGYNGHASDHAYLGEYLASEGIGWLDTYLSLIIPAIAKPLGLFLMKQFMEQIPTTLLEAARIDGASEWKIFWGIAMPQVKPAWLTLIIFCFQDLWNLQGSNYIYSEQLKTLPYALSQISAAGIARSGATAAVAVIMMVVPITIFMISQSNIIETMASSGIKE